MRRGEGDPLGEYSKPQLYAQPLDRKETGLVYVFTQVPVPFLNNGRVFMVVWMSPAHPPGRLP